MRHLLCLFALASAIAVPAAHADSITYSFTLINQTGNICSGAGCTAGSGTFTINTPPPTTINSQKYYYDNGTALTALSFTLDGNTTPFDLTEIQSGTQSVTYVRFTSGALDAINYVGLEDQNLKVTISLDADGLEYNYSNGLTGITSQGTILNIQQVVQNPGSPAVPEPSTMLLFGTGTLALAAFGLRRAYA